MGLLGTRYTMEDTFYRDRLADRFKLSILIPGGADRTVIHRAIYEELCLGKIVARSREAFRRIGTLSSLADRKAPS